ncbi:hypothetical protein ABT160_17950 [Streptomyces sp. NPDC001941]|uniref:hypothetical protein n=1 Tax=Streptomyces sp. NPDC001941 TaxID=3154659 RepID=UPI003321F51E
MLTIHAAALLLPGGGAAPVPDGAVAVRGREVAALGPYGEVAAAHPGARTRRWPGLIAPGLLNPYGPELLEGAYHPDPREADALGTEPLTGGALAALPMDPARRGAGARRGVQRLLAHGCVAVAGAWTHEPVRDAVLRAGLAVRPRTGTPPGVPSLDPLAALPPGRAYAAPLTVGGGADLAVFDAPDEEALAALGASVCLATVLAGRLVYRRR